MIEPEFDYAHLPWSLKFSVYSKFFGGLKVLHQSLLLRYFPARISEHMVKKGRRVVCFESRFLNDLF